MGNLRRIVVAIHVEWRNLTLCFALLLEQRNENINISFPRMTIKPVTCRVYSRMLVPLRHDWPQILSNQDYLIINYLFINY